MPITGTEKRFANMRVQCEEIEIAGEVFAAGEIVEGGQGALADLGGTIAGTVTGDLTEVSDASLAGAVAEINQNFLELQNTTNEILAALRASGLIET